MPVFELFQPTSVDDTVALLDKYEKDAWVLAGGLDTFDWFKDRNKRRQVVVDLSGVDALRGIKKASDGGLEIGAATTLTDLANHADVKAGYRLLAQAAGLVASPQIRNQGTIGGNVSQDTRCWYYRSGWTCYRAGGNICYADTPTAINREHAIFDANRCVAVNPSDVAPALIALDAQMVIHSKSGERVVAAREKTRRRVSGLAVAWIAAGAALVALILTFGPVSGAHMNPAVTLAELKNGDAIVVSSTVGATDGRITAITMLAGVEPILTKPGTQEMSLGSWNLDGGGIGAP